MLLGARLEPHRPSWHLSVRDPPVSTPPNVTFVAYAASQGFAALPSEYAVPVGVREVANDPTVKAPLVTWEAGSAGSRATLRVPEVRSPALPDKATVCTVCPPTVSVPVNTPLRQASVAEPRSYVADAAGVRDAAKEPTVNDPDPICCAGTGGSRATASVPVVRSPALPDRATGASACPF